MDKLKDVINFITKALESSIVELSTGENNLAEVNTKRGFLHGDSLLLW